MRHCRITDDEELTSNGSCVKRDPSARRRFRPIVAGTIVVVLAMVGALAWFWSWSWFVTDDDRALQDALSGRTFELVDGPDAAIAPEDPIALRFSVDQDDDRRIVGDGACNQLGFEYVLARGALRVSASTSTMVRCDDRSNRADEAVRRVFRDDPTLQFDCATLTIDGGDRPLVFEPAADT